MAKALKVGTRDGLGPGSPCLAIVEGPPIVNLAAGGVVSIGLPIDKVKRAVWASVDESAVVVSVVIDDTRSWIARLVRFGFGFGLDATDRSSKDQ